MTTALLLIVVIGLPLLGGLVLHFAKQATAERVRADTNESTALEIAKQAGSLGEHRTSADVLASLRKKAAAKRLRETDR